MRTLLAMTLLGVALGAADTHVEMWGTSSAGHLTVPAGLKDVAHAAMNWRAAYVIHKDGTGTAWGDTTFRLTHLNSSYRSPGPLPDGLTNAKQIVVMASMGLILKRDGTVQAFGAPGTVIPTEKIIWDAAKTWTNIASLVPGNQALLAIKNTGELIGAGRESFVTIPAEAKTGIRSVACTQDSVVVVKDNGTMIGWGDADGDIRGSIPAWKSIPPGITDAAAVYSSDSWQMPSYNLTLVHNDRSVTVISGNLFSSAPHYRKNSAADIIFATAPSAEVVGSGTPSTVLLLKSIAGGETVLDTRDSITGAVVTNPVTLVPRAAVSYYCLQCLVGLMVVNDPPTISSIADQTIAKDSSGSVSLTVGDHASETPAASLQLTASSSNATLFPAGSLVLGGTGANRSLTFTPAAGLDGTATITLRVQDGGGHSATRRFVVTVGSGGGGSSEPLSYTFTSFELNGVVPSGVTSVTSSEGTVSVSGSTWTATVPASATEVTISYHFSGGAVSSRTFLINR